LAGTTVFKKNIILRNYPFFGHFRYIISYGRHEFQDWILEQETEGKPFDHVARYIVKRCAQGKLETLPYGSMYDFRKNGYEWLIHSIFPTQKIQDDLRIQVGSKECLQPYSSSIFNASAMSFGSISKNAVMAVNGGAQLAGFAQNTGEGGLTNYHLRYSGDIIFQFGTGYFGCRDKDGNFSEEKFKEVAAIPQVKMIEMKISQGAKPGLGGLLPATKNTKEIAKFRGITPHTVVLSPPAHTSFNTPLEMLFFIQKLRDLSGGKPVGFKLCIGSKAEFLSICKAMIETGIKPDYITIDGGEGGTGDAEFEAVNSIGMPIHDALPFVYDALTGFDLKNHIKIYASGKVLNAFDIVKMLPLGADACNSARGMMFSIGCVLAYKCNTNNCPTGITSQKPEVVNGLVVKEKQQTAAQYHRRTIESVKNMLVAAGLCSLNDLKRSHILRRMSDSKIKSLEEIYPYIETGSLLKKPYPEHFQKDMELAKATHFHPWY
jgi:glutamate synthase domain-containing protein 2